MVHREGPLWYAVRCSSSLIVLFPPVTDPEGLLLDGAFVNNIPVDFLETDFTVASDVGSESELKFPSYGTTASGASLFIRRMLGMESGSPSLASLMLEMTFLVDAQKSSEER